MCNSKYHILYSRLLVNNHKHILAKFGFNESPRTFNCIRVNTIIIRIHKMNRVIHCDVLITRRQILDASVLYVSAYVTMYYLLPITKFPVYVLLFRPLIPAPAGAGKK